MLMMHLCSSEREGWVEWARHCDTEPAVTATSGVSPAPWLPRGAETGGDGASLPGCTAPRGAKRTQDSKNQPEDSKTTF